MKEVSRQGAQGDVLFRRVQRLPKTAVEVARKDGTPLIVAHSETGHHHTVGAQDVRFYNEPQNPLICYLQLGDGACDVVHNRAWDTHETLRLLGKPGTVFEVRRQREWTPEGWRVVAD